MCVSAQPRTSRAAADTGPGPSRKRREAVYAVSASPALVPEEEEEVPAPKRRKPQQQQQPLAGGETLCPHVERLCQLIRLLSGAPPSVKKVPK